MGPGCIYRKVAVGSLMTTGSSWAEEVAVVEQGVVDKALAVGVGVGLLLHTVYTSRSFQGHSRRAFLVQNLHWRR